MLKGTGCGMLAIFKKINLATVLRMGHRRKLRSRKGGLDIHGCLGKRFWWLGYLSWDLVRKSR